MRSISSTLFLLATFAGATACASNPPPPRREVVVERVYVTQPPPAEVVEVIPAQPSPDHVWIRGFHRWNGNAYVWTPGHWQPHPVGYTRWEPGHWQRHEDGQRYFWVEGHWRA